MWLLDANVPAKLVFLLQEFGIEAVTAQTKGWGGLSNGALLEAASSAGFSCVLTRDRLFGESAARALKKFPAVSVVVINLPQLRERHFLEAFRAAWHTTPALLVPGRVTSWPLQ